MDDRNAFLRELIGPEILNIYGVFVAISLASAAQIHLALNYIEEKRGRLYFDRTRGEIRQNCLYILSLFGIAVVLLLVKPLMGGHGVGEALINAVSLWLLVAYMTVLWDMTRAVFLIRAQVGKPLAAHPRERQDDQPARSKEKREP